MILWNRLVLPKPATLPKPRAFRTETTNQDFPSSDLLESLNLDWNRDDPDSKLCRVWNIISFDEVVNAAMGLESFAIKVLERALPQAQQEYRQGVSLKTLKEVKSTALHNPLAKWIVGAHENPSEVLDDLYLPIRQVSKSVSLLHLQVLGEIWKYNNTHAWNGAKWDASIKLDLVEDTLRLTPKEFGEQWFQKNIIRFEFLTGEDARYIAAPDGSPKISTLSYEWNTLSIVALALLRARGNRDWMYMAAEECLGWRNFYTGTALLHALREENAGRKTSGWNFDILDSSNNYANYRRWWDGDSGGFPFLFAHMAKILMACTKEERKIQASKFLQEGTFIGVEKIAMTPHLRITETLATNGALLPSNTNTNTSGTLRQPSGIELEILFCDSIAVSKPSGAQDVGNDYRSLASGSYTFRWWDFLYSAMHKFLLTIKSLLSKNAEDSAV